MANELTAQANEELTRIKRREYMRKYMRAYRLRQRNETTSVHQACDRRIAELEAENKELRKQNEELREALPF